MGRVLAADLTAITSGFSSPGPEWNEFSTSSAASSAGPGWAVTVDRSKAAGGMWTVEGRRASFSVVRTYTLDPLPPAEPRRVLVNDTISTPPSEDWPANEPPSASSVLGISVRHTATVAASADAVDTAIVPGAYGGWQCDTHGNPGDTCGANCFDRAAKRTNNGRPDVFANRSSATSHSSFSVGLVALDDVFRVHAQTAQRAMRTGPRMEGMKMSCNVTEPPTIELADPNLALRRGGDTYVQEWAVYPFFAPASPAAAAVPVAVAAVTDFYAFVNAQRHDLGSDRIAMQRTGFLGPASSACSIASAIVRVCSLGRFSSGCCRRGAASRLPGGGALLHELAQLQISSPEIRPAGRCDVHNRSSRAAPVAQAEAGPVPARLGATPDGRAAAASSTQGA